MRELVIPATSADAVPMKSRRLIVMSVAPAEAESVRAIC
jgi:hypothetical protein